MSYIESVLESFEITYPILADISCLSLGAMISDTPVLYQSNKTAKNARDDENMYCTVGAVKSKSSPSLSSEKLIRIRGIGLKTEIKTLYATTHQCIRSTGVLSKRFKTDKSQLLYKHISIRYSTFYVDYLKVGVKSARQFIRGTLYTNKLEFKMFFLCSNETSE